MLLIFLAALLLGACKETPPSYDYLTGKPCAAPCWQGITPGVTYEADALSILFDLDMVEEGSIRKSYGTVSGRGYSFEYIKGDRVTIDFKGGVVTRIGLPTRHLTLGDLIGDFASPDFAYVQMGDAERICYFISLYDLEGGIWTNGSICKGDKGDEKYQVLQVGEDAQANIFPEMAVGLIILFEPDPELSVVLGDSLMYPPETVQIIMRDAVPWNGFGHYTVAP